MRFDRSFYVSVSMGPRDNIGSFENEVETMETAILGNVAISGRHYYPDVLLIEVEMYTPFHIEQSQCEDRCAL
jgi:hypothetical protein